MPGLAFNGTLAASILVCGLGSAESAPFDCVNLKQSPGEMSKHARVEADSREEAFEKASPSFSAPATILCSQVFHNDEERAAAFEKDKAMAAAAHGGTNNSNGSTSVGSSGAQMPVFKTPGFNAAGLNMETAITALYLGDFEHARLKPSSMQFNMLLGEYIHSYFRQCSAYLPPDKVELEKIECGTEEYEVRNGIRQPGSRCVQYRETTSGVFTTPQLYAARAQARKSMTSEITATALKDPFSLMARSFDAYAALGTDMDKLLQQNGCDGEGTRRFQDNLTRFALEQQASRLLSGDTLETARIKKVPGTSTQPFRDLDYAKLLDDLVTENSKLWISNRYEPDSIRDVRVLGRDAKGNPQGISATYNYRVLNGPVRQNGVKLVFTEGLPGCLFFYDAPQTCRAAGPRTITQYENGQYQR